MKKVIGSLLFALLSMAIFTACNKDNISTLEDLKTSDELATEISLTSFEPEVMLMGTGRREDYQRVVVEKLVKAQDSKEIVSGIVEFYYQNELVFAVDFGNGNADGLATITWIEDDGSTQSKEVEAKEVFNNERKREDRERSRCFKYVLPISFTMADNSTITIETKDDWAKLKTWHEANPDNRTRPVLQFPVNITLKNGETKTLNNRRELRRAKNNCKEAKEKCFEYVLPISFTMGDNSTITIETREDWAKLKTWHEANPDNRTRPVLQFPVNITLKNGETKTLNNKEELKGVKQSCGNGEHHDGDSDDDDDHDGDSDDDSDDDSDG